MSIFIVPMTMGWQTIVGVAVMLVLAFAIGVCMWFQAVMRMFWVSMAIFVIIMRVGRGVLVGVVVRVGCCAVFVRVRVG